MLKDRDINPRWADLIQSRRLLHELLGPELGPVVGPALPGDGEELESKTEEQLDALLVEMLERSREIVIDVAEQTEHTEH